MEAARTRPIQTPRTRRGPRLFRVVRLRSSVAHRGSVTMRRLLRVLLVACLLGLLDRRVQPCLRVALFRQFLLVDLVAHFFFLSTARSSWSLFMPERPSMFSFLASL